MRKALNPARDPLKRTVAANLAAAFAPLGVGVRFETNCEKLLELFRTSFGRYDEIAAERAVFQIRLLVDPAFTTTPPWPRPIVRGQTDLLYISVNNENTAVADLGRRHAFGFFSPAMVEDSAFLKTVFLECLVFAMATHGTGATHSYVHASAVAAGDHGLVFSGPQEAGKSTLAYACARQGFKIVTDDVLYLRTGSEGLVGWGRPWRLRFLRDCVRFFPELDREETPLTDKDGLEIEVEELLPSGTQMCCKPSALFFLDRSGDPAAVEPLDSESALDLLARDLIADAPAVIENHCRTWMQLIGQGSYVLHYGNLNEAVHLMKRFHRDLGAN